MSPHCSAGSRYALGTEGALENSVKRQLNTPRGSGAADDAKPLGVWSDRVVIAGHAQHSVIQHVEGLRMEVELYRLPDSEILVEAGIEVFDAGRGSLKDADPCVAEEQLL